MPEFDMKRKQMSLDNKLFRRWRRDRRLDRLIAENDFIKTIFCRGDVSGKIGLLYKILFAERPFAIAF